MQTERQRLLDDLWCREIPLERRAWRFRMYCEENELSVDAINGLLRCLPDELFEYVRAREK